NFVSFHRAASHPALHSFPTRRSSDLHQRKIVFRRQEGEAAPHLVIAPDAGDGKLERGEFSKNVPAILTQLAIFVVGELAVIVTRSEEHTSELQSLAYLVCRLLLEKKK